MGHDSDEFGARGVELAQALRGLALERIEGRLVDRERRLVRERTDERDFLIRELGVPGNVERDRADEPVPGDERQGEPVGAHDRSGLGERDAGRGERGSWQRPRARAKHGLAALVTEQDAAG